MPDELTAEAFLQRLDAHRTPEKAQSYESLKAGDDDVILGVRMGTVFALAKEFIGMPLDEVEKLLESHAHEARVGAVSIMDYQARGKKTPAAQKQAVFDLYLRRHDRINTWDLVDRAVMHVVGSYLIDKPRDVLYELARSERPMERRTAILGTGYFIGRGDLDDTYKLAEMLIDDPEDTIHKAVGWMLREAGKQDRPRLLAFLDQHADTMPRVTLRYAIEHLEADQRAHYLGLKKAR